jgi:hypothetical protein
VSLAKNGGYMSGQQVISDFIQEIIATANNNLESLNNANLSPLELEQAQVDLNIAKTIEDLFLRSQLTDKRLQERLRQLREGSSHG